MIVALLLCFLHLHNNHMSFLFHKNTKNTIKWVWGVIALIIILSMIFAYSGGGAIFF